MVKMIETNKINAPNPAPKIYEILSNLDVKVKNLIELKYTIINIQNGNNCGFKKRVLINGFYRASENNTMGKKWGDPTIRKY